MGGSGRASGKRVGGPVEPTATGLNCVGLLIGGSFFSKDSRHFLSTGFSFLDSTNLDPNSIFAFPTADSQPPLNILFSRGVVESANADAKCPL